MVNASFFCLSKYSPTRVIGERFWWHRVSVTLQTKLRAGLLFAISPVRYNYTPNVTLKNYLKTCDSNQKARPPHIRQVCDRCGLSHSNSRDNRPILIGVFWQIWRLQRFPSNSVSLQTGWPCSCQSFTVNQGVWQQYVFTQLWRILNPKNSSYLHCISKNNNVVVVNVNPSIVFITVS